MNIIDIITRIDDVDELERIYRSLEKRAGDKPAIKDAIIELREGLTYNEILAEQNYKQISYKEFKELTEKIEWEHSLEELLEEMD